MMDIDSSPLAMARWYESDFCGEQTDQGRALRAYLQEIRQSLREIRRVLREGGVVALALANSFRIGREFDLVSAFVEMLTEAGFSDISRVDRSSNGRRILPAGRDPFTGRFTPGSKPSHVREQLVFATRP